MKKILVFASLLSLMFTSCNKINEDNTTDKAKVQFALHLPTVATKADQLATTNESTINTVSVWVFGPTGVAATTGNFEQYVFADFTPSGTAYELPDGKAFSTEAGNGKIIYIGVNVPTAFDVAYTSEGALKAAIATLTQGTPANRLLTWTGTGSATNVAMFSNRQVVNLAAYDPAANSGAGNIQEVSADIHRIVSKVVTTKQAATFTNDWATLASDATLPVLTYTIMDNAVYQDAHASFLAQQTPSLIDINDAPATWSNVLNPHFAAVASTDHKFKAVTTLAAGSTEAQRQGIDGFYVGENKPTVAKYGNATYTLVRTGVSVNRTAKVNSAGTAIEWVASVYGYDAIPANRTDVHVMYKDGNCYIVDDANLSQVATFLGNGTPIDAQTYTDGYVYFMVYLNPSASYNVDRNQYVHVDITGIEQSLTFGTNVYPGDPTDPEVPTEPDPGQPNPYDPPLVIDGQSQLKVKITIAPWDYVATPTVLK